MFVEDLLLAAIPSSRSMLSTTANRGSRGWQERAPRGEGGHQHPLELANCFGNYHALWVRSSRFQAIDALSTNRRALGAIDVPWLQIHGPWGLPIDALCGLPIEAGAHFWGAIPTPHPPNTHHAAPLESAADSSWQRCSTLPLPRTPARSPFASALARLALTSAASADGRSLARNWHVGAPMTHMGAPAGGGRALSEFSPCMGLSRIVGRPDTRTICGWPVRQCLRLSRWPPKPFVPTKPLRPGPLRPSNGPYACCHHVTRTTASASATGGWIARQGS